MVYRTLGKTGMELSTLGFGAMRLPMITGADGKKVVDDDQAIEMIHAAFDHGVNYIDTAPYYLENLSERTVGLAVKGYRDKVYVSTKNPIESNSGADYLERLERSLKNLDMDYIDVYHMWGISLDAFRNSINVKDGPMEAALRAKEEGLIKHIAFSFHDKPENMKEIIDSGYFESVLMQYNLLDRANEQNIDYAYEKGLGVIIMGPVAGGRLGAPSPVIQGMLSGKASSTAELALRFVLANPHVTVALSGMQSLDMVKENLAVASIEGHLTEDEKETINKMVEEKKELAKLYCTGCNYCMPCPKGLDIPKIFSLMNYHKIYDITAYAKEEYKALEKNATACVECKSCQKKCPQKLAIIKQLKETHQALA
ncbi:aldo/keto reductase [Lachnospiraceae bacterium ZAX-1]